MAKYNIKRLRSYIEKAIADACKSENRPNDVTFDAFIIDNAALLLILHCKYQRVQRRVYYRILNNVTKHFGLSIVGVPGLVDVRGLWCGELFCHALGSIFIPLNTTIAFLYDKVSTSVDISLLRPWVQIPPLSTYS